MGENRLSAATWKDGALTLLPGLGGQGLSNAALDVNSAGLIVGYSAEPVSGLLRPVYWKDGVVTELPTLGGIFGGARGVNDAGWIVGGSHLAGVPDRHATLWKDGVAIDLGAPALSINSAALDISASGDILGQYTLLTSPEITRTFLHSGGIMYAFEDLLGPGSGLSRVTVDSLSAGMNEAGEFAGTALRQGQLHAFLFSPCPCRSPPARRWRSARRRERSPGGGGADAPCQGETCHSPRPGGGLPVSPRKVSGESSPAAVILPAVSG